MARVRGPYALYRVVTPHVEPQSYGWLRFNLPPSLHSYFAQWATEQLYVTEVRVPTSALPRLFSLRIAAGSAQEVLDYIRQVHAAAAAHFEMEIPLANEVQPPTEYTRSGSGAADFLLERRRFRLGLTGNPRLDFYYILAILRELWQRRRRG